MQPMLHNPLPIHGPAFPLILIVVIGIGVLVGLVITLVPFWRICTKAGFPGALSLLMLIPLGNILLPFYLAFAEWPALKRAPEKGGPEAW